MLELQLTSDFTLSIPSGTSGGPDAIQASRSCSSEEESNAKSCRDCSSDDFTQVTQSKDATEDEKSSAMDRKCHEASAAEPISSDWQQGSLSGCRSGVESMPSVGETLPSTCSADEGITSVDSDLVLKFRSFEDDPSCAGTAENSLMNLKASHQIDDNNSTCSESVFLYHANSLKSQQNASEVISSKPSQSTLHPVLEEEHAQLITRQNELDLDGEVSETPRTGTDAVMACLLYTSPSPRD